MYQMNGRSGIKIYLTKIDTVLADDIIYGVTAVHGLLRKAKVELIFTQILHSKWHTYYEI